MNLNLHLKRGVSWIHIAPDNSSTSSRGIKRGVSTVNEKSRPILGYAPITLYVRGADQQGLYTSLGLHGNRFLHPSSEMRMSFTSQRDS